MSKKLLIFTGPQGSGNHLWSKIISNHPDVIGWKELTQEYWVLHGQETFNLYWKNPDLFKRGEFLNGNYYTSISCPYMTKGNSPDMTGLPMEVPDYEMFIRRAIEAGFEVKVGVIGREVNILKYQQMRVRKKITYPALLKEIDRVLYKYDPIYVSTELLYLYRGRYLSQLEKAFDFPIRINDDTLSDIIAENENAKYVKRVDHHWLDDLMKQMTAADPSYRIPKE